MTFYPIFLNLVGRSCAVIGGGAVAEHKVQGLVDAGARVTVISPTVSLRLEQLAADGTIVLIRRAYRPGDLADTFLAIAASDDRRVNHTIWEESVREGGLLNAVDDLPHCHFIAPAIFRRGDLTLAVSTSGRSPALAVRVRDRLGSVLGPEYAILLDLLGDIRAAVASRLPEATTRTALWYRIIDSDALDLIRRGDVDAARRRMAALLDAAAQTPPESAPAVTAEGRGATPP